MQLAAHKLANPQSPTDAELILVLIDADEDLPCILGPHLLQVAKNARSDKEIACVIANVEFETWFVAAAESLSGYLTVEPDEIPADPESGRSGKGWVRQRMSRYSETVDQPKLTDAMDLQLCRRRSPSFDKLCREIEARITP